MKDFLVAVGFLTKLPISKKRGGESETLARSMRYFPLVGFLLGIILVLANIFLTRVFPEPITNLILLILLIALTGALHLDGFADTIDGLCSKAKTKEETLDIMRDSRIGTMAVIALVMLLLLKYEALNNTPGQFKNIALALMCALSRWSQVMAAHFSNYPRDKGLGKPFVGNIPKPVFYAATALAILIAVCLWRAKGALVFSALLVSTLIFMKYTSKRIGGMTGDTIGAISEINEVLVLLIITGAV